MMALGAVVFGLLVFLLLVVGTLREARWQWPCQLGLHRWTSGSPWQEDGIGGLYEVRACDRCGPENGWREFWTPLPSNEKGRKFMVDFNSQGIQQGFLH